MHPNASGLGRNALIKAKALRHVVQVTGLLLASAAEFAAQQRLQGPHHKAVGPQGQAFCPGQALPHQRGAPWSNNCW